MINNENEEIVFQDIVSRLSTSNRSVTEGKMMSSPGIRFKNKVFAFYHNKSMIFKLGKGYDIKSKGVNEYVFLNPFKNKSPMTAWFEVPVSGINKWFELAKVAMQNMISEIK